MSTLSQENFNSVMVRARGERCLISTVAPPFRTAYWPDVAALASAVGLPAFSASSLKRLDAQATLLNALAGRVPAAAPFRPASVGFRTRPETIRRREALRASSRLVTFVGDCSAHIVRSALALVAGQLTNRATVNVQFKHWDVLRDWRTGRQRVDDALAVLYQSGRCRGSMTLFSGLEALPPDLWRFLYDHPRVRVGWLANELLASFDDSRFDCHRRESLAFCNLSALAEKGAWPHVILPISGCNAGATPELVAALLEVTRGGTIEIVPAALLPEKADPALSSMPSRAKFETKEPAPDQDTEPQPAFLTKYVEVLSVIYRTKRIPLRLIAPFSWVTARTDSQEPLPSSPAAAGTEIAVLPNGDLYAGEASAGLDQWRLGNALEESDGIRWERLDLIAEAFSNSSKPEQCQRCDWRYRCGGVEASVPLLEERLRTARGHTEQGPRVRNLEAPGSQQVEGALPSLFDLYCAPRRALFEQVLWDSVEAAANANRSQRELLELHESGIAFVPANRVLRGRRLTTTEHATTKEEVRK